MSLIRMLKILQNHKFNELLLFFFLIIILVTKVVHSVTITPTSYTKNITPTLTHEKRPVSNEEEINLLRKNLAARVKSDKTIYVSFGYLSQINNKQIILTGFNKSIKSFDIENGITQFFVEGKQKTASPEAIFTENDILSITTEGKDGTMALKINKENPPVIISGEIVLIDNDNTTITLVGTNRTELTFNLKKVSLQMLQPKTYSLKKADFSKIKVGDYAHVLYYQSKKKTESIVPTRFSIIPKELLEF